MDFGAIKSVWGDILHFLDRVMGWLAYTLGGAKTPYDYDNFWENQFGPLWDRETNSDSGD